MNGHSYAKTNHIGTSGSSSQNCKMDNDSDATESSDANSSEASYKPNGAVIITFSLIISVRFIVITISVANEKPRKTKSAI